MKWRGTVYALLVPLQIASGQQFEQLVYNKFLATTTKTFESTATGELVIKDFRGDISISGHSAKEVRIVRKTYLIVNSEEKAERLLKRAKVTFRSEATEQLLSTAFQTESAVLAITWKSPSPPFSLWRSRAAAVILISIQFRARLTSLPRVEILI